MRADLFQRAEERRARSPGPRRLGPAQPRGLQGPLVEGHGGGGPAARDPSVRPPSARGASLHPTQRKSQAAAGRRGKPGGPCPQGRGRASRKDGRTDGRARGRAGTRAARDGVWVRAAAAWRPAAFLHPQGFPGRAARGSSRGSAGRRRPRRRGEPRVPLKFAGGQESAGCSFPPSGLEREEEAREVPPTPGEREGRRKKGKGEEKRAGPGTTCGSRGRRAQRPQPVAAPAPQRTLPGRARAHSPQTPTSPPQLPLAAPGRWGRALARPPGRGGAQCGRRGGGGAGTAAANSACAAHLRPCPQRSAVWSAPPRGERPGPLGVPRYLPLPFWKVANASGPPGWTSKRTSLNVLWPGVL
nr:collagen alpha-1(I) chain-like [Chlorocebus sabaeus]XP_037856749.1 collagen alpha-1(I) chain-like [Chlorocebus sabaeus]XP_037856750.1 collagen alpha-1(I) chain-like [Chlorocebus sabaeus]XP_037856751.1 collagen alpha-1(I) chain-like [Chlorocebus sabaeus]